MSSLNARVGLVPVDVVICEPGQCDEMSVAPPLPMVVERELADPVTGGHHPGRRAGGEGGPHRFQHRRVGALGDVGDGHEQFAIGHRASVLGRVAAIIDRRGWVAQLVRAHDS